MSLSDLQNCKGYWTDLPLHQLLYEWIVKNMSVPADLSVIVAYVGLFLLLWYAIVWVTRFIITVIWPIFLIVSAIIVFRILQFYEPEEIANIAIKALTIVADTIAMIMAKALESALQIFE